PESPLVLGAVRAALVALVLLPATTIMGATLPLFTRMYVYEGSPLIRRVGGLYGLNTLGAAAGAATAGFVLLPNLGLALSLSMAASLSITIGVAVALLPLSHTRRLVQRTS